MNSQDGIGQVRRQWRVGDNLAFADRDKERTFIDSIVGGPVHNRDSFRCGDGDELHAGAHRRAARARSDVGRASAHGETLQAWHGRGKSLQ